MKITSKIIGLVLALIVVILAVFLVTKFNSHESARVSTSSSPVKTVKKSSSSSSKAVKKDKKSVQSSSSAVTNEENDNQASAVAPKVSSQEQAQAGTTDGGQVAESAAGTDKAKSEKNTNNSQSSLDLVPLTMVILALLWELGLMRMVNQLQLMLMVQLLKTQQVILLN